AAPKRSKKSISVNIIDRLALNFGMVPPRYYWKWAGGSRNYSRTRRYNRTLDVTSETSMKFTGTESYVATEDLMMAVNAAVTLERPLLIKGEPGTGKTMLAIEVAK